LKHLVDWAVINNNNILTVLAQFVFKVCASQSCGKKSHRFR